MRQRGILSRTGLLGGAALSLGACLSLLAGPAAAQDPPAKPTAADSASPAATPTATPAQSPTPKKRPELRVVDALGADGVKLSEPFEDVSHTFTIESLDKQGVTELQVQVDPLFDAAGTPHDVTWTLNSKPGSARVPVAAFGSVPLHIHASLPVTGVYTGQLFLIHDDGRDPIKLTVTRGPRAASVEIPSLDPVSGTADVLGESSADLWVTLRETSGAQIDLPVVDMITWSRKDGKTPARYGSGLSFSVEGLDSHTKKLALAPHETRRVKLTLGRIAGAGEYTGTLRVSEAGAQPIDRTFTLSLREPAWWAALLIFGGAMVSFASRRWGQDLRPRLVLQRKIALVQDELAERATSLAPLSDEEARVHEVLRRQIAAFRVDLDVEVPKDADAKVAVFGKRQSLFGDWTQACRKVSSLEPSELRAQFQATLTTAETDLRDPNATAEKLGADSKALVDLVSTTIPGAVREALAKGIGELEKDIRELQKGGTSPLISKLASEVTPSLTRAKERARESNASLNEAVRDYSAARRGYLTLLIDDLADAVRRSPLPAERTSGISETLRSARETTGEDTAGAAQSYEAAFTAYLIATKEHLESKRQALSDKLEGKNLTPEEKQWLADSDPKTEIEPKKRELEDIQRRIEGVSQKIQARDFSGASVECAAAASALGKVRLESGTRSRALSPPHVAGATAPIAAWGSVPAALHGAEGAIIESGTALDDSRSVKKKIDTIDYVIEFAAAAATTLGGTVVLFADNATWGGWPSWTTAFLLGLGVQQVTGAGVAQIADKIRGKKETA